MKKEDLLKKIHFKDEVEQQTANFYLNMKGVAFHKTILDYLCKNENKIIPIDWMDISKELRSDKAIRDILYKYLATLEEYIRAYISNKYEDDCLQKFWIDTGLYDYDRIKTQLLKGKTLFKILENVSFGTLIKQVKALPKSDRQDMFGKAGTNENLDAVRELRNAVSHHKFLKTFEFKPCTVDGDKSNSLIFNINNLRQLLPTQYRYGKNGMGGITGDLRLIKVII